MGGEEGRNESLEREGLFFGFFFAQKKIRGEERLI